MKNNSPAVIVLRLAFIFLTIVLLIGHGSIDFPSSSSSNNEHTGPYYPCDSFAALLSGNTICIDSHETSQDLLALSGLTSINGNLVITDTDFDNLDFLLPITEITGTLVIYANKNLKSITPGRQAYVRLGGVEVYNNPNLVALDGIESQTPIRGSIQISGSPLITTLAPLNPATTLKSLTLEDNINVSDWSLFENVTSIDGDLTITNNNLADFTPFRNITHSARLFIGHCIAPSLGGFENLTGLQSLFIRSCENLTSLQGISSLDQIKRLWIESNPLLTDLSALPPLPNFMGDISIVDNAALQTLSVLETVTWLTGNLFIYKNPALSNIDALNNITSIGGLGGLNFSSNPNITSLAPLSNLEQVGGLTITDNSQLTTLGLTSLAADFGMFSVKDNPSLCNQEAIDLLNQVQDRQHDTIPSYNLDIQNNKDC